MSEGIQTPKGTDESETQFWSMYPQNVHLATTASSGSGFSLENKKIFATFGFIGFTVVIGVLGFYLGNKIGVGLLGFIIGIVVGVILSLFLYSKLLRDKFNEEFESETNNKILKLFRVRLNDVDRQELVNNVAPLMSYTNGEVFVTLRIEIGNSNESTEAMTAQFLDKIFKAAHQLQLKVKNYNIPAEWKKSDIYYHHVKTLTKVQDPKLKATLANIDSYQSDIFEKSKVIAIHLVFSTRRNNLHSLSSLVDSIEDWKSESLFMSSIRTMDWIDKDTTVKALCDFLTVQMLDVTSNMNKNTVPYDVRKLVRVFSNSRFRPDEDIDVETKAKIIRRRKGATK